MELSTASLEFLKDQELNPNWNGLKEIVEPTTVAYANVVIRKISYAYDKVLKVELYSKKYDIWIYVRCTPHHDAYVYQYDNDESVVIPNAILVSLPLEEDCS
jgi:hypothetical protein